MAELLSDEIIRKIDQAGELYHRLVILIAPAGAGKTAALQDVHERTGAPLFNVNLELSRRMLDLTERQRALQLFRLLSASTKVRSVMETSVSQAAFGKGQSVAEEYGKAVCEALVQEHRGRIAPGREKADYAFAVRRKNGERIGLSQVRNYRLNLFSQEERSFQGQFDQKVPDYAAHGATVCDSGRGASRR